MSQHFVEKIIGAWYVMEDGKLFAADIYEGNYYKLMDGNIQKTVPLVKTDYDRVVQQYNDCVKNGQRIESAYEKNQRMCLEFTVPEITADPEASEKEWYIRTHPQVVHTPEPVVKKKKGLFGRKEKKNIGIKCLSCGHVNKEGQKFCGECGEKLAGKDEEIIETPVQNKDAEAVQAAAPVVAPTVIPTVVPTVTPAVAEPEKKPVEVKTENVQPTAVKETPATVTKEVKELTAAEEVKKEPDVKETAESKESEAVKESEDAAEESLTVEETKEETAEDDEKEEKEESSKGRKNKKNKKNEKEKKEKKKNRSEWKVILILLLILVLGVGGFALATNYGGILDKVIFDSQKLPLAQNSEVIQDNYVIIKLKRDVAQNSKITEADIDGALITAEQYEKYSVLSTYVDKDGQTKKENLILWDDKDSVLGKYASRALQKGTILYDTAITTEHVVAEKNFVDVEVNGQGDTIQVENDVLPGNTRIQIVAIIQTDGGEPSQVLLSEMMLQDRSLQSIFNSAGEDILKMLSEEGTGNAAPNNADNAQTAPDAGAAEQTQQAPAPQQNPQPQPTP